MRRLSIVFLIAVATPIWAYPPPPKPNANLIRGWGIFVDPDKDCRCTEEKGILALVIPAKNHDFSFRYNATRTNAPRVLQSAHGDFKLQVKVQEFGAPKEETSTEGGIRIQSGFSAGLLIWKDEKNFLRLDRFMSSNSIKPSIRVTAYQEGRTTPGRRAMVADSVTLFQIKRIGKKITMEYKDPDNDTEWVAIDRPVVEFSGELQVGVTAANTGSEAFTVKFEGLKFEEK